MSLALDHLNQQLAGRYAGARELGRGGMATVWLARDLRHDRPVALKVLHPELAGAIGVDRFVREVRLTARLQHPNIVPVLDSGILSGAGGSQLPWYVAVTWLRRYTPRQDLHFQLHLRCDPPFAPIGNDPRFQELLLLSRPERGC